MRRWGVFLGAALTLGALLASSGRLVAKPPAGEKIPYVGSETCAGCHQDLAKEWEQLPHAQYLMASGRKVEGQGCEECHGPGGKHAAGDTKAILGKGLKPVQEAKMCLQCHQDKLKAQDWHTGPHAAAQVACTSCHSVHHASEGPKSLRKAVPDLCFGCHPSERAQFKQNSHHPVLEGRLNCLDCHNAHKANNEGTTGRSARELCINCHPDKSGPFVFQHEAGSDGVSEGCLTCHRSHGSPNPQLQRAAGRGLCQQCHFDRLNHNPGRTCWMAGCHSEIHGSHTSNLFLR